MRLYVMMTLGFVLSATLFGLIKEGKNNGKDFFMLLILSIVYLVAFIGTLFI